MGTHRARRRARGRRGAPAAVDRSLPAAAARPSRYGVGLLRAHLAPRRAAPNVMGQQPRGSGCCREPAAGRGTTIGAGSMKLSLLHWPLLALFALLVGCAQLGVPTPETTQERIAVT